MLTFMQLLTDFTETSLEPYHFAQLPC